MNYHMIFVACEPTATFTGELDPSLFLWADAGRTAESPATVEGSAAPGDSNGSDTDNRPVKKARTCNRRAIVPSATGRRCYSKRRIAVPEVHSNVFTGSVYDAWSREVRTLFLTTPEKMIKVRCEQKGVMRVRLPLQVFCAQIVSSGDWALAQQLLECIEQRIITPGKSCRKVEVIAFQDKLVIYPSHHVRDHTVVNTAEFSHFETYITSPNTQQLSATFGKSSFTVVGGYTTYLGNVISEYTATSVTGFGSTPLGSGADEIENGALPLRVELLESEPNIVVRFYLELEEETSS